MSPIKLALLSVVAVFAASAVGAASASAHYFSVCETRGTSEAHWSNSQCSERGGTEKYTTKELASEEIEGGASETIELAATIAGAKITIGCAKAEIEVKAGFVEKEGKTRATVFYSKCALYETNTGKQLTKCEVPNITAKAKGDLEGSPLEIKFEPAEGSAFAEISVKGASCAEKFSNELIEGTQKCELPSTGGFAASHSVDCKPSGGHLTFDRAPATYRGSIGVKLRNDECWAAA